MTPLGPVSAEPDIWHVVFHRDTPHRWLRWLAWGRYKHVSALGYVAAARAWIFVEVGIGRTLIGVVPDASADEVIAQRTRGADIIAMEPGAAAWLKPGLWCVPVISHLLGLPGCALRPDTLFRQCLANGGRLIHEERAADAEEPAGHLQHAGGAERSRA